MHPEVCRSSTLKRLQYTINGDSLKFLSKDVITAKLYSQLNMLLWMEKCFEVSFNDQICVMKATEEKIRICNSKKALLAIEGNFGRSYWSAVKMFYLKSGISKAELKE